MTQTFSAEDFRKIGDIFARGLDFEPGLRGPEIIDAALRIAERVADEEAAAICEGLEVIPLHRAPTPHDMLQAIDAVRAALTKP